MVAKSRPESGLNLSPSSTIYWLHNWTNDMTSLSISFLICGEDHAYLVLGRVFQESVNTGIGHMGLASIESHCLHIGPSRKEPWVGTASRSFKSSRLPVPCPRTDRWGFINSPLPMSKQGWVSAPLSSVVKVFIVSLWTGLCVTGGQTT